MTYHLPKAPSPWGLGFNIQILGGQRFRPYSVITVSLPATACFSPPKFVQARNHPSLLPFRAKARPSLESPNAHPTWKHRVEAKLPSTFFSRSRTSPQQNHASLRPSQLTVNGIDYSFHIHPPHSQHPTFPTHPGLPIPQAWSTQSNARAQTSWAFWKRRFNEETN